AGVRRGQRRRARGGPPLDRVAGDVVAQAGVRPHPAVRALARGVRRDPGYAADPGCTARLGLARDARAPAVATVQPGARAGAAGGSARGRRWRAPARAPPGAGRRGARARHPADAGVSAVRRRAVAVDAVAVADVRADRVPVRIAARDLVAVIR